MRWPADHPTQTDEALAEWRDGADELCPDAVVVRVLRHLPQRRVATLVDTPDGPGVLKIFARPRARGNHRRLQALADSHAVLVPRPRGVDRSGHVSLVSFVEGTVFDQLDDDAFVRAAPLVGEALRTLHNSAVELDRRWTIDDELTQLERRFSREVAALVPDAIAARDALASAKLVPAHRDCHPRQVVACGTAVRWIDLDDAAMASPALDVGNFVAHLRRDAAIAARDPDVTAVAIDRFVAGYGSWPSGGEQWEQLTLARLAGLAERRHQRADWSAAIAQLLCR